MSDDEKKLIDKKNSSDLRRNLFGFWLLGLSNNFGYVVMLSSAHDILTPSNQTNVTEEWRKGKLIDYCNPIGTGAVLLADIVPALLIKFLAPIVFHRFSYLPRVIATIILSALSFIFVSFGGSKSIALGLVGVVLASAATGLGETTFLGLTSYFDKNVISTWASGTGGAGLLGSLSYAAMTSAGISPKITLLIMLIIPCIMTFSYFTILVSPDENLLYSHKSSPGEEGPVSGVGGGVEGMIAESLEVTPNMKVVDERSFFQKFKALKPLLRYMIPLFFVYLIEYIINMALFELTYFKETWLNVAQQYRWYLVIYQVGVFVSRSSVNLIHIPHIWVFPILQFLIMCLFLFQIFFRFISTIFLIFFIIILEGLLSGGAYVNTFYSILHKIDKRDQELSMSVTCISDSLGITSAALLAIPIHNFLCSL